MRQTDQKPRPNETNNRSHSRKKSQNDRNKSESEKLNIFQLSILFKSQGIASTKMQRQTFVFIRCSPYVRLAIVVVATVAVFCFCFYFVCFEPKKKNISGNIVHTDRSGYVT